VRRRAVLVAGLVSVLLAAGCGVPDNSGVRVDGPPDGSGVSGSAGQAQALPPPGPDDADSQEELVQFFLRAAAADPEHAVDKLRPFIHPRDRDAWDPGEQVFVARIGDEPPRTLGDPNEFALTVQRIGELRPDGVIEQVSYEKEKVSIYVTTIRAGEDGVRTGGERYRIVDPPPNYILLDDDALDSHFQARSLYFWDHNGDRLVPDLRWIPNSIPRFERSQRALQWLFAGPASWLSTAVNELPQGVELEGNVVPTPDDSLDVLLTAPRDDLDLPALAAQLWWTLRPDLDGGIEVTVVINGDRTPLRGDYEHSNPAPEERTASFAIVDGVIVPYLPPDVAPPQVLERERFNQGIERAALSRNGRLAAVVRRQADGRQRLDLAGPNGVTDTDLTAVAMSRPVWLNNPAGTGLVAADGVLYSFASGESDVTRMDPPNLADITAVAVAPDGRRLALIADGELNVTSMVRNEGVQIRTPRGIRTTAKELAGVAFTRENWLAVIGAGEEQQELYELTVDGGLEQQLAGLGSPGEVDNVVAFPVHPAAEDRETISIMYEADGGTWRFTQREPVEVAAADLLDDPPQDASPRAPFFLD
jgi:hypothetical protein